MVFVCGFLHYDLLQEGGIAVAIHVGLFAVATAREKAGGIEEASLAIPAETGKTPDNFDMQKKVPKKQRYFIRKRVNLGTWMGRLHISATFTWC